MCYFDARIPTEALTTITSISAVSSTGWCPKCGTSKKSSKSSCCARGGAWYKKCGDASDITFNHTWPEGIYACKHYASSVSIKSPLQVTLHHHVGAIPYQPNTSHSRNIAPQQTNIYRSGSIGDADTTESKDRVELVKAVVFVCVLFIM